MNNEFFRIILFRRANFESQVAGKMYGQGFATQLQNQKAYKIIFLSL